MPAPKVKPHPKGIGARLTAKAGPLPVWAWAALILAAVFAYTKLHGTSSSSSSPATAGTSGLDTSTGDTSGQPTGGAAGGGGGLGDPAGNLNDALLAALSGFQGSIDNLTGQLQTTEAVPQQSAPQQGAAPAAAVAPTSSSSGGGNTYAAAAKAVQTPQGAAVAQKAAGNVGGAAQAITGFISLGGPKPAPKIAAPSAPAPPSRYVAPAPKPAPKPVAPKPSPYDLRGLSLVAGA